MKSILLTAFALVSFSATSHAAETWTCTCQLSMNERPLITERKIQVPVAGTDELQFGTMCDTPKYAIYMETMDSEAAVAVLDIKDETRAFPAMTKTVTTKIQGDRFNLTSAGHDLNGQSYSGEVWCFKNAADAR